MELHLRNLVEKRRAAVLIAAREVGRFGRSTEYYIRGFRQIEKVARNTADELERSLIQLQIPTGEGEN